MKRIYLFSGLGADESVFQYLDLSGFDTTFIHWISPYKNEPIEIYAKRLTEQIVTNRPILIGLSFGGIMAIEVAKLIDVQKVILISSAKTQQEIPFYYRLAGRLKIHKLLPAKLMKRPNSFSYWLFGATHTKDKQLLATILRDTDEHFLKWAIDKIVSWTNRTQFKNLIHIHGTADRILPIRFVACDFTIVGGGHLMVVNKCVELSRKIRSLL